MYCSTRPGAAVHPPQNLCGSSLYIIMGNRIRNIGHYFWNHKFVWATIVFLLIIGFFDSDSVWVRWQIQRDNARLRAEIQKFEQQCTRDSAKLEQLLTNQEAVVKVARESHLMKADNEDVYIVSVVPAESDSL